MISELRKSQDDTDVSINGLMGLCGRRSPGSCAEDANEARTEDIEAWLAAPEVGFVGQ